MTAESGEQWLQREPKVFARGQLVVGIVGCSRWQNALQELTPRRRYAGGDPAAWLRAEVLPRLAELSELSEQEREDSEALLGFAGRLWVLEAVGAVWAVAGSTTAIGSGAGPARGVLRYTASRRVARALALGPRERLRAALEAAEACDANTRRPFHVVTV